MRVFTLDREQVVPVSREAAFAFFTDAGNLESITPPFLNFEIVTPLPITIEKDTRLDYRLRLHGVPFRWRTRITEWNPTESFVDRQERGPYRLWEHHHRFEEVAGGTRVVDHVRYAVPFGAWVERWFVRKDLKRIFDYRSEQLDRLLGSS